MTDSAPRGDGPDDVEGDVDPGDTAFTQATAAASGGGSIPPDEQVDEARKLADERLGSDDADTD